MAPTLFGGLQVSLLSSNQKPLHVGAPVPDDLAVVVFVPDFEMPTQEGRRRIARTTFTREDYHRILDDVLGKRQNPHGAATSMLGKITF